MGGALSLSATPFPAHRCRLAHRISATIALREIIARQAEQGAREIQASRRTIALQLSHTKHPERK